MEYLNDTQEQIENDLIELCEKVAEIADTDIVFIDAKTTLWDAIKELLDRQDMISRFAD